MVQPGGSHKLQCQWNGIVIAMFHENISFKWVQASTLINIIISSSIIIIIVVVTIVVVVVVVVIIIIIIIIIVIIIPSRCTAC